MGTNTAGTPEVSTEDEQIVDVEQPESENAADASEVPDDGGEEEQQQEPVELEVVRSGEDGSQPDTQRGIRNRVNKLNAKVAQAEDTASEAGQALAVSEEKVKLLTLALEQKTPAEMPTPPDPTDYDEGVRNPKYAQALDQYNQPLIAAEVQRQTANLAPVQTETVNPELERKQSEYYKRADELGATKFDESEAVVINAIGKDVLNHIIRVSDKSHLIVSYLGKNPSQAEKYGELFKNDPVDAMMQIGQLAAELNVKPRANSELTPDPDEELSGGSPAAAKTNKFQKRLDAAREAAQDGGSGRMQAIADIKKEAGVAGVTVI